MQNEQRNFDKPSPEDEKKKYILRKRQEWEDNKEIKEFFFGTKSNKNSNYSEETYTPLSFPVRDDND